MELNIKKIEELITTRFRGNLSFFAEVIGVDRGYLYQISKNEKDNKSPKICNAIISFCEKNNLNYKDYIFLN